MTQQLATLFCTTPQANQMKPEDEGKEVVVIVSEHQGRTQTVKGTITQVIDEDIFEVKDSHGNISRWNERQIKGLKFVGGGDG